VRRRRRELAALVTLLALAGCGGSEEEAARVTTTVTVTTTVSGWTAGDCDAAGEHAGSLYRLCFRSRGERAIEMLRGGDVYEVPVYDPTRATGGHWRWAALSPDGKTFLATWSGECEIPIAFTFPARGGSPPEVVTGEEDWRTAPESEALGWTTDGEPIVRLLRGACGTGADEPGVYVFGDGGPRRVDEALEPSQTPRDVE
jgi:hypothetical protein